MNDDRKEPAKPQSPDATTAPPKGKRVLIIGAVVVVGLLAAYGGGRLQGAQATGAAEDRAKAAEGKTEEARSAVAAREAEVQRLEARRRLHLALIAIDERNFGIAQKHLAASGQLLAKSSKEGDLGKLGSDLVSERLVATEDLSAQRSKLLGWVRRLDQAMPPLEP